MPFAHPSNDHLTTASPSFPLPGPPARLLLISRNYHVIFLVRLNGGGGIRSTSCGKAKARGGEGGRERGQDGTRDCIHVRLEYVFHELHLKMRYNHRYTMGEQYT